LSILQIAPRQRNYTPDEEALLTQSWLNVAQDPIVGTGQKSDAFWGRVAEQYAKFAPTATTARSASSLQTKWKIISDDVSKFVAAYAAACDLNASGTNDDDVMNQAQVIYSDKNDKAFAYLSSWQILRTVPKWSDFRKCSPDDATTNDDGDDKGANGVFQPDRTEGGQTEETRGPWRRQE